VLPGTSADEVLVAAHAYDPPLANDNLAGIAVATWLARTLGAAGHWLTYRFVFAAGTIGALTWLARNESVATRITHGLLLTCAGDRRGITYKKTRRGDAVVDHAAAHVLRTSDRLHRVIIFSRTLTTNGNTARPLLTCRSAASCARRTANIPSITPRRIISTIRQAAADLERVGLVEQVAQ